MPLRKVLLFSTAQNAAAASFTNVTARRLHIRKAQGYMASSVADSLGETNTSSLDEARTNQSTTNDSRAHIASVGAAVIGGTGAVVMQPASVIINFNRGDLVLDTDEAIFMNNSATVGAATPNTSWNLFYED